MSARERLIVALDVPHSAAARGLSEKLHGHVGMFKVGLELFTAEGPAVARFLVGQGERVFLDLKFHDIPNTVRAAVREAARSGVTMTNVHAAGGRKMMEAAREGAEQGSSVRKRPIVLAVTVLTSLRAEDLEDIGIAGAPPDAVVRLAILSKQSGADGVVASAKEAAAIRRVCGEDFLIVTPGIRPVSAAAHDQSRVTTPEIAIRAGADYLVVGRPITEAPDPQAAADSIADEIEKELGLARLVAREA